MSAFTTVNPAGALPAATTVNGQTPTSPPVSQPDPEPELDDNDSILSDPPPHHDDMMQLDGHLDGHLDMKGDPDDPNGQEPNPKKRKRYNDPPNEVHAELRRPQLAGQWYSKTVEQWDELSHLHKLIYSHVGRIEETELGEEVTPCEACKKRGFKCMKYKQDHPEVEKLYKGNVRVGTSCTRCRRYRRTCAAPGTKKLNGNGGTPNRPTSNGYGPASGVDGYAQNTPTGGDGLDNWESTLLAAAAGGSPLTSVASTPEIAEPEHAPLPPTQHTLPPPLHQQPPPPVVMPQHHHTPMHSMAHPPQQTLHPLPSNHLFASTNDLVQRVSNFQQAKALDAELEMLRSERVQYQKDRQHWKDKNRDLQSELYHSREETRHQREENRHSREEHRRLQETNWTLQAKIERLEKEAGPGRTGDIDRVMAEAELRVTNRQQTGQIETLQAERNALKSKVREQKREIKTLRNQLHEYQMEEVEESLTTTPATAIAPSAPVISDAAPISTTPALPVTPAQPTAAFEAQ